MTEDRWRGAIRLAKEATNGWACYAKRDVEHMEIERLHKEIGALLASGPLHQEGWQPIETAPKDHSWFLAWSADLGYFVYRTGPGLIAAEEPDPTHWMSLPAPPLDAQTKAGTE